MTKTGRPRVISVRETMPDSAPAAIIQSLINKVERLEVTATELQNRLEATKISTAAKDELMLKSLQQLTNKLETLEESRALVTAAPSAVAVAASTSHDPNLCHYLDRKLGIACGNPRSSGSLFCSLHDESPKFPCRYRSRRGWPCSSVAASAEMPYCAKHRPKFCLNTKKCRAITHSGRQCVDAPAAGGILCNNHLRSQNKKKK